jgi:hypothetical protein
MGKELSSKVLDGIKIAGEFFPIYGSLQREKMSAHERNQTRYTIKTAVQTTGSSVVIALPFIIMIVYAIQDTLNYN